jgi:hypothetical protein
MSNIARWVSWVGVVLAMGCGGGAEETTSGETEGTAGSESQATSSEAPTVETIARYEGEMTEGLRVTIALDAASGGTFTSHVADRVTTFHDCQDDGSVLRCRLTDPDEGDLELTRHDGGADVRVRQASDNVWVEFTVTEVAL